MSADDGYLIRQRSNGKWIAQYCNMSVERPPLESGYTVYNEFDTQEDAISFIREAARETEYGVHQIIPYVGEHKPHAESIDDPITLVIDEDDSMFERDLIALLSGYSIGTKSSTSPHILAHFLVRIIDSYEETVIEQLKENNVAAYYDEMQRFGIVTAAEARGKVAKDLDVKS